MARGDEVSGQAWTTEQIVIVARMYNNYDNDAIAAEVSKVGPPRTRNSVANKANDMGLEKLINCGQFKKGAQPYCPPLSKYRPLIAAIFARDTETTIDKLVEETGASRSGVRYILRGLKFQGNIHVCGYEGYMAVWRIGDGKNAIRPRKKRVAVERTVAPNMKLDAIPQPTKWLWGLPQATDYNQAGAAG